MSEQLCVVCNGPLGDHPLRLRYEGKVYAFDAERCKRIF